jgi:hypothetical protein
VRPVLRSDGLPHYFHGPACPAGEAIHQSRGGAR